MGYFDELSDGHNELETEAGEAAVYHGPNGDVNFKGVFEEVNPSTTLVLAAADVMDSLTCDAKRSWFATAPVAKKKVTYLGKTYVVRDVFPITGNAYRFKLYVP